MVEQGEIKMAQDPDLVRQFVWFLTDQLAIKENGDEIRADSFAVLNGHLSQV